MIQYKCIDVGIESFFLKPLKKENLQQDQYSNAS